MSITNVSLNNLTPFPGRLHESDWPGEHDVDLDASALTCHVAFWKPLAATDDLSKRLARIRRMTH